MSENATNIAITRGYHLELLKNKKKQTRHRIIRRIAACEKIVQQLEDFVHWPALEDSFKADVLELRRLLDRIPADA